MLVVCFSTKVGKHPTEVDNIHNILATAAVQFNSNQLEHLFVLIQQVHFAWLLLSVRFRITFLQLSLQISNFQDYGYENL